MVNEFGKTKCIPHTQTFACPQAKQDQDKA